MGQAFQHTDSCSTTYFAVCQKPTEGLFVLTLLFTLLGHFKDLEMKSYTAGSAVHVC